MPQPALLQPGDLFMTVFQRDCTKTTWRACRRSRVVRKMAPGTPKRRVIEPGALPSRIWERRHLCSFFPLRPVYTTTYILILSLALQLTAHDQELSPARTCARHDMGSCLAKDSHRCYSSAMIDPEVELTSDAARKEIAHHDIPWTPCDTVNSIRIKFRL
jgi:hypothetical protein